MTSSKLDVQNTFKPSERGFSLPNKLIVGAGPTNCSPRVLSALTNHSMSPTCKELFQVMDDIKDFLKYVFQTKNQVTLAMQNSGTGELEAALANLVDPWEKIIIAVAGIWGERTVEKAKIRKIDVVKMVSEPSEVFTMEELEREIIQHKPVLLFITHGESSGGTVQPLELLGDICHKHNCLLAVDAVVSLGGVPFFADRWSVDVVVAATQKAIGAPPGIALMTFSPRAVYYYTYNFHMLCATREALAEIAEEGLENVWERHRRTAERFWKGLEKLGLTHFIKNPEHRLWTVNLFHIPPKVKWPVLVDYFFRKSYVNVSKPLNYSNSCSLSNINSYTLLRQTQTCLCILPNKLLVGPGPSNCSPRVISAQGACSMGVVCDELYEMMDDIQEMLRYVFQTKNVTTLALQNSGSGGIEAAFGNVVHSAEKILVGVGGVWGDRVVDIAKIRNPDVVKIESKVGEVFTLEELEEAIIKHKPALLFITHGESSVGTIQPLEGLGDIGHIHNCLLAVDASATLGGVPFFTDRWDIDVALSCSQNAIGAPPGMSLLTLSSKAAFQKYHYTLNSHSLCALREALQVLVEEGLDNVWERHERAASRFWQGIEKMGLKHFVEKPKTRLQTIHLFYVSPKINWAVVANYLSEKYQVVTGFGIGPSLNKAAQVGIMGYNARPEVVDYVLKILDEGIKFAHNED